MPRRILIIDDEEHIRRMMRITLEASGYTVGEASDGPEGLKLYDDGSNWDVIVLDQRMPGMDGLETLKHIKSVSAGARVVMATAYASIELAVDAMKLGATDFVRKPLTPEVLRNSVSAALTKSPLATHADVGPTRFDSAQPLIQTVTMNGFTIFDDNKTATLEHHQRRFVVVSPGGQKDDVVVEIESEPIEYVERMTERRLGPHSSFWTAQAMRLLGDFLWNEGKVPATHRLVLKSLDPDKLPLAARWKA
jgi:Response regulator containing CheY-like receiver, AAA-type ATPase, and DNA-binding domains